MRKYPIGVQDFSKLREQEYLYIDKTALIHKMVTEGGAYFLARPRRFGKSLLISTLLALFEGKRRLFAGLAVDSLEWEWEATAVIQLDLNADFFKEGVDILKRHLIDALEDHATRYGVTLEDGSLATVFRRFLTALHEKTGKRVVVLVDEYDKPLLETMDDPVLHEEMKNILKGFYGVLKSADRHLLFVLLTGVTKFGQVSIFSDLNQLNDISLMDEYAALCGITLEELKATFPEELVSIAESQNIDQATLLRQIADWYNGYGFGRNAPSVYNPFSTLNFFQKRQFFAYWFQTGTPTFLLNLLEKSDYDLRDLERLTMPASGFADYRAGADTPVPVLYQTGYLTIKAYNPETGAFTLGYPNDEVRFSFLEHLVDRFTSVNTTERGLQILEFQRAIRQGDIDGFLNRLKIFYSAIPYDLTEQKERYYQTVFYLVFSLLGQYVRTEVRSSKGRCDAVVETEDTIFVIEFKLFDTAENALRQIAEKGYAEGYRASGKKIVCLGVEFDREKRNISRWVTKYDT